MKPRFYGPEEIRKLTSLSKTQNTKDLKLQSVIWRDDGEVQRSELKVQSAIL